MIRTHSRARASSAISGKWRLNSTAPASSPPSSYGRVLSSVGLLESEVGQRMRERQENEKADHSNDNNHDSHFWIAETLASDQQCNGNVALCGAKRHHPSRIDSGTTNEPTDPKAYCDQQKPRKHSTCAENLENVVNIQWYDQYY